MFFKSKSPSVDVLIEGCMANKRKSQELLYLQYFDTMADVCKKYTSDESEIILMVNDAFLKVFKNIHLFKKEGSFEGWLKKIIYHTLIDHFRSRDRKMAFLQFVEQVPDRHTEDNVIHHLICAEILELIDQLPENSRQALKLFIVEGYTHTEIATELNISEGTSRWHVSHARNLLRQKLNSYELDSIKLKIK